MLSRTVEVHVSVQYFYEQQMQLFDGGAYDKWALTFAEDAVFEIDLLPGALQGRSAIAAAALRMRDGLDRDDVRHRNWLGMLTVEPRADGWVSARCYGLVLATPRGGRPELRHTTVCEDLLRPGAAPGEWLVQDRYVVRDSLG